MASRVSWFLLGIIVAIVAFGAGAYFYIRVGGVSMATSAPRLPLEKMIARLALHASYGHAAQEKDPLKSDEVNLLAGARLYVQHCAVCHGTPHTPATAIAKGMAPRPPQLFEDTVTDDPEGITFWKVTNGIRLTGMPGFQKTLADTERWQVTMLLAHADELPEPIVSTLNR